MQKLNNWLLVVNKIKRTLRAECISYFKAKHFYFKIYKSYWHYRFSRKNKSVITLNYYAAIPNPGAGIGHQMANWIAGYRFSQQFNLQFAHIPFSNPNWETFLGFGEREKNIKELLNSGYCKVRLPLFDENNLIEIELQKIIIASYSNKKVVFVAEQDQFYRNQFGVIKAIQEKFYTASARKQDQLIYDHNHFNIAIHVRRGDIVIGQENKNDNLLMRWQGNDYFVTVLQNVLKIVKTEKSIKIYLFSQGTPKDFPQFEQFSNLHFCLDMNAKDSFLHMVYSDLLITSKSSFSYKPALLNRNIKVCPKEFWHGYPVNDDWVLVENDGNFEGSLN